MRFKLEFYGVSQVQGLEDIALLCLVDKQRGRQLVIACEKDMREKIMDYMKQTPGREKLYTHVMADIISAQEGCDWKVVITDVVDGVFITEIVDDAHDRHFPIRCSDGILFALLAKVGIYAVTQVMVRQSVPFEAGATKIGLPLTVLSDHMLEVSMQKAIECEDYEMASNLRDELKKRHAKQQ